MLNVDELLRAREILKEGSVRPDKDGYINFLVNETEWIPVNSDDPRLLEVKETWILS